MERPTEKDQIVSTQGTCGGKPRIAGTRIRVQDVVAWYEDQRRTPEEIAEAFPQLTLADVYAALAYYFQHYDEIKKQIRESAEFADGLRATLGPGPLESKLNGQAGNGASLPS
jgi:uncharacterized protein (DUF433 family)